MKRIGMVDILVGQRIRLARLAAGESQENLAGALGITFQQVQKYEKGTNRVGAGRLLAIAKHLAVPIDFFFEQVDGRGPDGATSGLAEITEALATPEGVRIARALGRISRPAVRRRLADLLEAIIAQEDEQVET